MSAHEPSARARPLVVEEEKPRGAGRPRLLLTNDDGIESPGLRLLAKHLARRHELVVVAPSEDRSGSGTAIGRFEPDHGVPVAEVELDGLEAYAIDGPPGLAVTAGALGAFGRPPDLVVSGVNSGMNTGRSVLHSGTVGAVLTARTFGSHGVALSLAPSDPWHWGSAVAAGLDVVDWLLERSGPPMVLNVNVPAAPLESIQGVRWARLDEFGHFRVATRSGAAPRVQFEVAGAHAGRDPRCDTALCEQGFVTLTPLSPLEALSFPDVPPDAVCRLGRARSPR